MKNPFGFNPPKEFGDRDDVGLGNLRQLHHIKHLPFAKSNPGDGTVAIKGNGFDTVLKKPAPPPTIGRYVTEGRYNGGSLSTVFLAAALRGAFKAEPLSVVGGQYGVLALGVNHTLLATSVPSAVGFGNAVFTIARSTNFTSKVVEMTANITLSNTGTAVYVYTGSAAHNKDPITGVVTNYEVCVFSHLDSTQNVNPIVIYSNAGAWSYAATQSYALYDHTSYRAWQLQPNTFLICHAVIARGGLYPLNSRPSTPLNQRTPYPLFQISTDCARTFSVITLDYLFTGSTYEYDYPRIGGPAAPAGLGGWYAISTIGVQLLVDYTFVSLEVVTDAALPGSYVRSINGYPGFNVQARLYRGTAQNLTSMTWVAVPPGYGTTWNGPLLPAFAESAPAAPPRVSGLPLTGFGTIGYLAKAIDQTTPNLLFVSFDHGATWEQPRPLPAKGFWCVTVKRAAPRELTCSVYVPTTPPQVVRYASTDYGLTWVQRQIIAQNVAPLGPLDTLDDFQRLLVLDPEDGSLPTPDPFSSWVYDSRFPRYTAH